MSCMISYAYIEHDVIRYITAGCQVQLTQMKQKKLKKTHPSFRAAFVASKISAPGVRDRVRVDVILTHTHTHTHTHRRYAEEEVEEKDAEEKDAEEKDAEEKDAEKEEEEEEEEEVSG